MYNYITNEYSISDSRAGAILGIKSLIDIAFGLAGSILVDVYGVRKVSLVALSVALVSRTLLAFSRSVGVLYVTLFALSPCGDALLSVGLYRVALKKLTTPKTRPLGFGLSYAVGNMAGACVALVVDGMRRYRGDVRVAFGGGSSSWFGNDWLNDIVGGVYTPIRQFIVSGWVVRMLYCCVCFLSGHEYPSSFFICVYLIFISSIHIIFGNTR